MRPLSPMERGRGRGGRRGRGRGRGGRGGRGHNTDYSTRK